MLSIISIVIIKKGWRGLNGPISERLLRLCGTFTVWIPSKPSLSRSFKGWTLLSAATAPGNQKSTGANELPVAISPDNRWLVTGSEDKTARLWDLSAKDPAANPVVLRGHDDRVWAVAISPDNRWLVTGSWDKTARLWLLQMSDLVHLARATVGRNFFANEWQLYLFVSFHII